MSTDLNKVEGFTPLIDLLVERYGMVTAAVFGMAWRFCQMDEKVCNAAQDKIAARLHLSRATVNHHLQVLVQAGYLRDENPNVRNRPHAYSDTGKAQIKTTTAAVVNEDPAPAGVKQIDTTPKNGVKQIDTKPIKSEVGVKEIDTGVNEIDSGCQSPLHLGVNLLDMKKDSLRDSLREDPRDISTSPHIAWEAITCQLRDGMSRADYEAWIQPLIPAGFREEDLVVQAINSYGRDWVASRLGARINRYYEAFTQQPGRKVLIEMTA